METREMKKLGISMPLLGMGLMRLPMKGDVIDEEQSLQMVKEMYDAGVRYFDTAYVYIGGESEKFAKIALTDRYPRDSFFITSKLPLNMVKTPEDNERIFSESCERMGVDYIDFYLLHGIDYNGWQTAVKMGSDKFQRKLKEDGRIRYAGFSFHGSPDDLRNILKEQPDWDFIQLQINYYDWYTSTAKELYEIVAEREIPCIVMEPVRGSALHELGDDVRKLFTDHDPDASNVEWAMRWVGSRPGINVVLSGVSTIEHVRENVRFYDPLVPMTDEEEGVVQNVVELIKSRPFIPCTGCRYCMPCPMGVGIPRIFSAVNDYTRLYDKGKALWIYYESMPEANRVSSCVECGACVTKCPQHIDIPAELKRCDALLERLHSES